MNPIIYLNSDLNNAYDDFSILSRIKDRFKINIERQDFIKDINVKIIKCKLPPNINEYAYMENIRRVKKQVREGNSYLAPKTYRFLDYKLYNEFEKNLFGFSVVNSSKLILRATHKSIRDSCIVLYDASEIIIQRIIYYLAREARYVVLVSKDRKQMRNLQEYVSANYGTSMISTSDLNYSLKNADLLITSKQIEVETNIPVWYLNNLYKPLKNQAFAINDVSFKVPWEFYEDEMPLEVLGALLSQMDEKDIEKSLDYNNISIKNIGYRKY